MSQITGNDEVLTKQDLQDYHTRILPYLNGVTCIDNTFDTSNLYSTEEKMIGQWIDGKPLYQKTIDCGAGPNNTTKNIAHGISNIGKVCDIKINMTKSTTSFAFPDVVLGSSLSLTQNIRCYVTGDNVIINSQQRDISDMYIIVTLYYTKTTDSAMTVPFGSVNEYSLTERIVGTWIDGKPIYQKTVSCGALPNKSSTITVTDIDNLKNVITLNGIATAQNYILPLPYVVYAGSAAVDVYIDKSTSVNIVIRTGVDQSSYTQSFITIQYTKTTD